MNVYTRFSSVLSKRTQLETVSLPLLTETSEILFTYYASVHPEGVVLSEVNRIWTRDRKTGHILEKEARDYFSPSELEKIKQGKPFLTPVGSEAIHLEELFYKTHEKLLADGFRGSPSLEEKTLLIRHFKTLSKIVTKGPLRDVYAKIGAETLQYMKKHGRGNTQTDH